jgi:hypothetical protein
MVRSNLVAEIVRVMTEPESWVLEAIATSDDGAIEMAIFSGPMARQRAIEYAQEKYADFRVHADADSFQAGRPDPSRPISRS